MKILIIISLLLTGCAVKTIQPASLTFSKTEICHNYTVYKGKAIKECQPLKQVLTTLNKSDNL